MFDVYLLSVFSIQLASVFQMVSSPVIIVSLFTYMVLAWHLPIRHILFISCTTLRSLRCDSESILSLRLELIDSSYDRILVFEF